VLQQLRVLQRISLMVLRQLMGMQEGAGGLAEEAGVATAVVAVEQQAGVAGTAVLQQQRLRMRTSRTLLRLQQPRQLQDCMLMMR
jgi:hypothetical protein